MPFAGKVFVVEFNHPSLDWTPLYGARSDAGSFTREQIDNTDKLDMPWRVGVSGMGFMTFSSSGVISTPAGETTMHDWINTKANTDPIVEARIVENGVVQYTSTFLITAYDRSGEETGAEEWAITLESMTVVTAGDPMEGILTNTLGVAITNTLGEFIEVTNKTQPTLIFVCGDDAGTPLGLTLTITASNGGPLTVTDNTPSISVDGGGGSDLAHTISNDGTTCVITYQNTFTPDTIQSSVSGYIDGYFFTSEIHGCVGVRPIAWSQTATGQIAIQQSHTGSDTSPPIWMQGILNGGTRYASTLWGYVPPLPVNDGAPQYLSVPAGGSNRPQFIIIIDEYIAQVDVWPIVWTFEAVAQGGLDVGTTSTPAYVTQATVGSTIPPYTTSGDPANYGGEAMNNVQVGINTTAQAITRSLPIAATVTIYRDGYVVYS